MIIANSTEYNHHACCQLCIDRYTKHNQEGSWNCFDSKIIKKQNRFNVFETVTIIMSRDRMGGVCACVCVCGGGALSVTHVLVCDHVALLTCVRLSVVEAILCV